MTTDAEREGTFELDRQVADAERSLAELAAAVRKAFDQDPPDFMAKRARQQFDADQRAWQRFYDQSCHYYSNAYFGELGPRRLYGNCRLRLLEQRRVELNNITDPDY